MKKTQRENQNRDSYQTGSTKPPKNYQGIITVLLILVIFLGGIVSALSMLNIRLFRMLENQNQSEGEPFLRLSRQDSSLSQGAREGICLPTLGLTGQEVTELCRSYYGWPEGLYISHITPSGAADKASLRQGDILTELDGIAITGEAALANAVAQRHAGETLLITVFRSGSHMTIPLTLE